MSPLLSSVKILHLAQVLLTLSGHALLALPKLAQTGCDAVLNPYQFIFRDVIQEDISVFIYMFKS